jgi:hypothetical protein
MPRPTSSVLALCLAFVLGCLATHYAPELPVAQANAGPPGPAPSRIPEGATRWEYQCMRTAALNFPVDEANAMGAQGWELVAFRESEGCFKRPL